MTTDGYQKIDDFMKLDLDTGTWTKLDAYTSLTGMPPSARDRHSMTIVGEDIYIFGGETGGLGGMKGRICHAWMMTCFVRHQCASGEARRSSGDEHLWVRSFPCHSA